jgi:hypothetical protein
MRFIVSFIVLAGPIVWLSAAGCGVACTLEARAGIEVVVIDSITGGIVSASTIILVAQEGVFKDSLQIARAQSANPVEITTERPGKYRVSVIASGYKEWVKEGVRVNEDQCHVGTVKLNAQLQPL